MSGSVAKALLSIDEFKIATGLGHTKTYEIIGSGELETVKVGRRRFVPAQSLAAWIENLRSGAA